MKTFGISDSKYPDLIFPVIQVQTGRSIIIVPSTKGIKIDHRIKLTNLSGVDFYGYVLDILSDTEIIIGNENKQSVNIDNYNNGSAYFFSKNRKVFSEGYAIRSVYDEYPTVALRSILVDWLGNYIDSTNPLAVSTTLLPTDILIYNIDITDINTIYNFIIPIHTISMDIRAEKIATINLSFNNTFNEQYTIAPGNIYQIRNLNITTPKTLYIKSNKLTKLQILLIKYV